nr:retrovirus-related Pol polyprotein from transposon TNT 1-94 [Tanacetum cinerariifolium]
MSIQEMKDLKQQYLDEMKHLINLEYHDEIKIDELKGNFNSMSIEINKKEKLQQLEQVANLRIYPSKRFSSFCYDDDDDEDYTITVTPSLSIGEPDNSLSGDKLVNWSSKKQDCTSMSSAEAEYMSFSVYCVQVLRLRTQLTDYEFCFDRIPMYCDSKVAIAISCNPVQHPRTKHIDVRYHFIKGQVEKGIVELFFFGTEYQLADMFTKALLEDMFKYFGRRLDMRCLTPEELVVLKNESA